MVPVRLPVYDQSVHPSDIQTPTPRQLLRPEANGRNVLKQSRNGDLPLQASERGSETIMNAHSKSQMPVGIASNLQFVRVWKLFLIPICRCDGSINEVTPLDELPM